MKYILKIITVVLISVFLFQCSKQKKGESRYVTIKGSDTMLHLASSWAEHLMEANPQTDISVTGGGSGTGIAALLNGTTDICIASRKIKIKELEQAKGLGIEIKEFVVARDGIAIVVNKENPIDDLSIEQIGSIYTGMFTNWNQLGGPDKEIIVLSRESSSGTYVFFQKRVMNKKDYTPNALLMPSTSAIIQSVKQDKWAIGYVGLGYAMSASDQIKMLSVYEGSQVNPIVPSVAAVQSGEYVVARPLHIYTNGEPQGLVKTIIDFCLSEEGQKIVEETGYVPVN